MMITLKRETWNRGEEANKTLQISDIVLWRKIFNKNPNNVKLNLNARGRIYWIFGSAVGAAGCCLFKYEVIMRHVMNINQLSSICYLLLFPAKLPRWIFNVFLSGADRICFSFVTTQRIHPPTLLSSPSANSFAVIYSP